MAGITTAEKDGAPVPGSWYNLSERESAENASKTCMNHLFTMSPITVANLLSPMPAASYIRQHGKSTTRKLPIPAARFGELVRQAAQPYRPHREELGHI
jgi:hypothetical protein